MASNGVRVGDAAPDFDLPSASGQRVRLSDYRGKSAVVLYFYPKDDTPGCTAQACSFRDQYETFRDAGAVVIGVSGDTLESHQKFAARHKLPFELVSDADGSLRAQYGVPKTLWVVPGRVTFLIDKEGIIRHHFSSLFQATKHVAEALRVLKETGQGAGGAK
jgi:peroxiredoxin Q/BCP